MAIRDLGNGQYETSDGARHNSYYDADNREGWNDITRSFGDIASEPGRAAIARARAEEDRRDAERERAEQKRSEFKPVIEQVFSLYNNGNIAEAIKYCIGNIQRKYSNDYFELLEPLAAVMLYKQGKYTEAINIGEAFVSSLCYEKLGEKQKATEMALNVLPTLSGKIESETAFLNGYGWNALYFSNSPFDIEYAEFTPLVIARAEEGNKAFYKVTGDVYRFGVGQKENYEKAKQWYNKAIQNNDVEAFYTVGMCLRKGYCGYQKDKKLGIEYLKKAASAGHDMAIESLRRNGFLGILFGLVLGAGIMMIPVWGYNKLELDNIGIMVAAILVSLIAGIIITYKAWVHRKNILLLVMLAISIIGFAGSFGGTKTSSSSKTAQTATLLMDTSIYESERHFEGFKALKAGDTVTVTGRTTRNWTPVEHGGDKGVIRQVYLEMTNQAVQDLIQQAAASGEAVKAKIADDTPLRREPNGESPANANLKKNNTVTLTGKKQTGTFRSTAGNIDLECAEVIYGGQTGWVTIRYLSAP